MPTAEPSLRDEYAAAVERVAGRTLDALRGAGGAVALAPVLGPEPGPELASAPGPEPASGSGGAASGALEPPRSLLAALRVVGPDLFAPQLLGGAAPDEPTALLLAQAHRVFPPMAAARAGQGTGAPDGNAVVAAWRDWAAGVLLVRALGAGPGSADPPFGVDPPVDGAAGSAERSVTEPAPAPAPAAVPGHAAWPDPAAWQAWSIRMAQLSALALPGLDGAVHRTARAHPLALARGAVRSMLRRDHRAAARLARWLAWSRAQGIALPLDVEPIIARIRVVSDGSARTALELAIAEALLDTAGERA